MSATTITRTDAARSAFERNNPDHEIASVAELNNGDVYVLYTPKGRSKATPKSYRVWAETITAEIARIREAAAEVKS